MLQQWAYCLNEKQNSFLRLYTITPDNVACINNEQSLAEWFLSVVGCILFQCFCIFKLQQNPVSELITVTVYDSCPQGTINPSVCLPAHRWVGVEKALILSNSESNEEVIEKHCITVLYTIQWFLCSNWEIQKNEVVISIWCNMIIWV